jgi:ADP-glucose pyrophosphorylase
MDGEDMRAKPWVASMGIYVFKKSVLQELLGGEFTQVMGEKVRVFWNVFWRGVRVDSGSSCRRCGRGVGGDVEAV